MFMPLSGNLNTDHAKQLSPFGVISRGAFGTGHTGESWEIPLLQPLLCLLTFQPSNLVSTTNICECWWNLSSYLLPDQSSKPASMLSCIQMCKTIIYICAYKYQQQQCWQKFAAILIHTHMLLHLLNHSVFGLISLICSSWPMLWFSVSQRGEAGEIKATCVSSPLGLGLTLLTQASEHAVAGKACAWVSFLLPDCWQLSVLGLGKKCTRFWEIF